MDKLLHALYWLKLPSAVRLEVYSCVIDEMKVTMDPADLLNTGKLFVTVAGRKAFESLVRTTAGICGQRNLDYWLKQHDREAYRLIGKKAPKQFSPID